MHDGSTTQRPPAWRSTRQRNAVLRALHDSPEFVSAKELHEALADTGGTVGLTTVYRTLRMLERAGHVDVVRDKGGERLYRPRPTDGHRHYLVCRGCGLSLAVDADAVERWADGVAESTGFAEVEHTVELTGICDRCRPRPARDAAPSRP
ncbi:Fur family transcriptional regulator [Streptomyces sp. V4I2]|uniref:Fur family transcriptional regulator n=1 Tax=Streptomyces sp. V4I2 TaxID=3042280 RepID=UPI002780F740|nr:Fur family transcriptional regulator [Streptomyces sp. V4I2]MDQ1049221.1 Fur family ferric uptake transcriptional regulator [Streptomyces sp. V4I2]